MRLPRAIRIVLVVFASVVLLAGLTASSLWLYFHPKTQRTNNVVYGERRGHSLGLDVIRPTNPNGLGIVLMVSGGWKSGKPGSFQDWMAAPLLRRGYTIFAVYHVSQPEATIMEVVQDVTRAVRFVRHHAREYRVDPSRLGVTGGSAGGHLSLMLAARGGPGKLDAEDAVERESSAVQAVAIFYPPTDLLNLGPSTENPGDGGPPKSFVKGFGPEVTNMAVWKVIGRELSPIYFVGSNLPPTLIYHGDADTLVPLEQSRRYQEDARARGAKVELVVHRGGQHGWLTMLWDIRQFSKWFDQHLRQS